MTAKIKCYNTVMRSKERNERIPGSAILRDSVNKDQKRERGSFFIVESVAEEDGGGGDGRGDDRGRNGGFAGDVVDGNRADCVVWVRESGISKETDVVRVLLVVPCIGEGICAI
jgi:hypothetical protein